MSDRKFRVLLDCDGVLADFVSAMLEACGSSLQPDEITDWGIFDLIGSADGDDVRRKALAIADDPDFWRSLPVIPLAQENVAHMMASDSEVFVVTSPWESCKGWDVARRQWLAEHFGIDRYHVVITPAKHVVSGDFFLDDKPEHVRAWRANNRGFAVLYDAPYNQGADCFRSTWDLESITSPPIDSLIFSSKTSP